MVTRDLVRGSTTEWPTDRVHRVARASAVPLIAGALSTGLEAEASSMRAEVVAAARGFLLDEFVVAAEGA